MGNCGQMRWKRAAMLLLVGTFAVPARVLADPPAGAREQIPSRLSLCARAIERLLERTASDSDQPPALSELRGVYALQLIDHQVDRTALNRRVERLDQIQLARVESAALQIRAGLKAGVDAQLLKAKVQWLISQQQGDGGWGYGPGHPYTEEDPQWTDIHHTLWAMQALDEAARSGMDVPAETWQQAVVYFQAGLNEDGGWGLQPPRQQGIRLKGQSHGSATAGAVLALLVAGAHLPETDKIEGMARSGLAWIRAQDGDQEHPGYLWARDWLETCRWLQRRARLSQLLGLDSRDARRKQMENLLALQARDGSFPSPRRGFSDRVLLQVTALAGRAMRSASRPAAMTLLPLGGDALCPARKALLVSQASALLKQSVALEKFEDSQAPTAPVCLLLSPEEAIGDPEQIATLGDGIRRCLARGRILLHAGSDPQTTQIIEQVAKSLSYQPEAIDASHPIASLRGTIEPETVATLTGWSDGARTRIVLLGVREALSPALAANLVAYATDEQKLKLAPSREWPDGASAQTRSIRVARLRHAGAWKTCPQALDNLHHILTHAQSVGVKQVEAQALAKVPEADLLWLTSSRPVTFTPEQKANLQRYLRGGGTLLADSTVGTGPMLASLQGQMEEIFGPDSVVALGADDPLITGRFDGGAGSDLRQVRWSRAARKTAPPDHPVLLGVRIGGRLAVILSPHGLMAQLQPRPVYGLVGLEKSDAQRLAANVALYVLSQGADE